MTRREHPCIPPATANYPEILAQRLGQFAPMLHCRPALPRNLPRMLAIVGTRGATLAAVAATTELARAVCRDLGLGIVSGGALGVDTAAHRGALAAGGITIAVLGSGLNQLYPQRNIPLFREISGSSGALITPFPDDFPPRRAHFIARNRLVAALAEAVLVMEAPLRSGALNTAGQARELGIPVLAVAGSPGTAMLLASGAIEIRTAADIEAALSGMLAPGARQPENPDDRVVLAALEHTTTLCIDAVAARAGMSVPRAAAALVRLEVDGWVRSQAGGYLSVASCPND